MNWALSAQVAFNAREFDAALEFARQATIIAPGFYAAIITIWRWPPSALGMDALALDTLAKSLSSGNTNSKLHSLRGMCLRRPAGRPRRAAC